MLFMLTVNIGCLLQFICISDPGNELGYITVFQCFKEAGNEIAANANNYNNNIKVTHAHARA
jgi:hypothetical protein